MRARGGFVYRGAIVNYYAGVLPKGKRQGVNRTETLERREEAYSLITGVMV